MALARDRGGALAALLATPSVGFNAGRRSRVDGSDGSDDRDGDVWGSISYYPSIDSALVDALTPDWRAGDANADARTLATLAADTADDLAAAIADAKRRRRRKYRDDLSDNELSDEFAREVSHARRCSRCARVAPERASSGGGGGLFERRRSRAARRDSPPLLLAVKSTRLPPKQRQRGPPRLTPTTTRAKARRCCVPGRHRGRGASPALCASRALPARDALRDGRRARGADEFQRRFQRRRRRAETRVLRRRENA